MHPHTTENLPKKKTSVLAGLGWSYLSAGLYALLQLAVIGVLAHILDPKAFGLLGMALIFTNIAERLGQIGIAPALVQREQLTDSHRNVGATVGIVLGFAMAAILAALAPLFATFFHEPALTPIIQVLSLLFVFDGFTLLSDITLQRELRFRELAAIENIAYVLGAGVVGIGGAFLGWGVWALVASQLALRFFRLILFRWFVPARFSWSLERSALRDLLLKGFGFSAGRLLSFVALYGDNFVIGRVLGPSALGIYSRSYQLMTLPSTYVGQMADRVLFPALAGRQKDTQALSHAMLILIEVLALVAMPISMVMVFASEEIIGFLLGPNWGEAVAILGILAYGVFFRAGYKCGDTIIRSVGEVYRHARIQGIYAILVIAGSLLGSQWGTRGVAWGVLIAVFINYLMMSSLALKLVKLSWKDFLFAHRSAVWISSWIGVVLFLTLPLLRGQIETNIVRLCVMGMLCALTSLIGWMVMPRMLLGPLLLFLQTKIPPSLMQGRYGSLVRVMVKG